MTCLHEFAVCAREIGRSFVDGIGHSPMGRHCNPELSFGIETPPNTLRSGDRLRVRGE